MTDEEGRVRSTYESPTEIHRSTSGRVEPQHDEATVVLVRAVMDYIDGECVGRGTEDHEEGCDACAFDALLQALPSALQRAAIRYEPVTAPASTSRTGRDDV